MRERDKKEEIWYLWISKDERRYCRNVFPFHSTQTLAYTLCNNITHVFIIIIINIINMVLSFSWLFASSACPVCYLPVEQAISLMPKAPSIYFVIWNLTYVYEVNSNRTEAFGGFEFGGYPSISEVEEWFFKLKESMNVCCGYDLFFLSSFGYLYLYVYNKYLLKVLIKNYNKFIINLNYKPKTIFYFNNINICQI